ncbi:hypothetical protein Dimus_035981 [Dionaea muscipula]
MFSVVTELPLLGPGGGAASAVAGAEIKTPKSGRARRVLEKRAPKLVEDGKKTLILHGTKTSIIINAVLAEIYNLKKGSAVKFTRKNENIRPFESGGETSLEFFSLKTDCSLFVFGSEGFETVEELKHLKEVLLDLLQGEVVDNLNLAGLDRIYLCTAFSSNRVFFSHCALKLKKSGTTVPRIELVELGPSMDLVVRRHRLPNESLRKEAMKQAPEKTKKKLKNVKGDAILGTVGKIYIPDQKVGETALPHKVKGLKRQRREAKLKSEAVNGNTSKKQKQDSE